MTVPASANRRYALTGASWSTTSSDAPVATVKRTALGSRPQRVTRDASPGSRACATLRCESNTVGPVSLSSSKSFGPRFMARGAGVGLGAAAIWVGAHRSSPTVRNWRPSTLPGERVGPLHVRSGGSGERVVVLLHGLIASGDVFGADFDVLASDNTVVVPDLLGFGRSLDEARSQFEPDDHLDALDGVLNRLSLSEHPIAIGAHSMGSALAIRWAERLGNRVERIVCWGAPVYADAETVDAAIADSAPMARMFVADTRLAHMTCRLSCRHRTAAGWVAVAMTPSMPTAIARAASLHTWPAYRDAMNMLVGGTDWGHFTRLLADTNTDLLLVWGDDDPIGDRDYARSLVRGHPDGAEARVATGELLLGEVHSVRGADHHLPMTHGSLCASQLVASGAYGLGSLEPAATPRPEAD